MPTYIVLYKFTEEGRKNIKETVRRAEQTRAENTRRGFRMIGTWWTQGQYDLVAVVNAPNEAAMMGGLYNVAEAGNVSSETLRAFTETEMRGVLRQARAATRAARAAARRPAARRGARRPAARRARPAARRAAPPAARRA